MIEVRGLTKRSNGSAAVDDVSFTVAEGEVLALVGTSGCGKSTTLKMINRLVEPTEGRITLDGRDTAAMRLEDLRLGIGYVIQAIGLFRTGPSPATWRPFPGCSAGAVDGSTGA